MQVHCAHSRMVDIELLQENPRNPNSHPEKQIKLLAKIMNHQGWRNPITVSKRSGFIVSGHGRIMAARLNGWTQCPVDDQDFQTEADEYAHLIADNKIQELAESNEELIQEIALDLGPDYDFDLFGVDDDFKIKGIDTEPPDGEDDVPNAPVEATAKKGQIYKLGRHRLMCGDCITDSEFLMGGNKASLYLTDPPYGVSYADKNKSLNSMGFGNKLTDRIENDHQTPQQMYEFWKKAFTRAHDSLHDICSYYITSPQGAELFGLLIQSLNDSGFQLKHTLVWAKNKPAFGRCDYNYKHEPIVYGWKHKQTHKFYGKGRHLTSLWEIKRPHKNDLHPTMKPIELLENAILNSSLEGQIVLDQFGGSGSTLIACEKTNRTCYMMEIEPKYIDVIIKRYETYTGNKAELIKDV